MHELRKGGYHELEALGGELQRGLNQGWKPWAVMKSETEKFRFQETKESSQRGGPIPSPHFPSSGICTAGS